MSVVDPNLDTPLINLTPVDISLTAVLGDIV